MRVGTSGFSSSNTSRSKDHPHACGDKAIFFAFDFLCAGSSPCVWGQVLAAWNTYKNDRIIPMRVGTRKEKPNDATTDEDHPHACGDKSV